MTSAGEDNSSRGSSSRKPPTETERWCYTSVDDDKVFTYAWTIEKFKKIAEEYPVNKTMHSEQFIIPLKKRNTVWRLKIYPSGRNSVDEGFVTVFLKDSGRVEPANVKAKVEFSVIDSSGQRVNIRSVDKEYKVLNHAFGFSKFIRHTELFDPLQLLLPDGNLTLHCTIRIKIMAFKNVASHPLFGLETETGIESEKGSSTFSTQMLGLLSSTSQNFSDVKIQCSDGEVDCHCALLAARSPVFKAMFSHSTKETESRIIQVEDMDKETCLRMLEYMYTGQLVTSNINLKLLIVADKYNVEDLKEFCERQLARNLDFDNLMETLIIADRHNCKLLKEKAMNVLSVHSYQLLDVPDWKLQLSSNPGLIAEVLEKLITSSPPVKRRRFSYNEMTAQP